MAIVNDEEITASDLNGELTNAKIAPSMGTGEVRARMLQALIDRRLLAQQAKSDGLDKSPEFLNQQRRMTENLLINLVVSRQLNTAEVPSANEISRFQASRPEMFAGREIWRLEQLQYATPKDTAVRTRLSQAKSLEEIAKILSGSGAQFTRSSGRVDTAVFPHDVIVRIKALPQGEPFIVPGGDRSVANVIVQREPAPRTGEQARTLALSAMRQMQAQKLLQDRIKAARSSAEIEYQSGFEPPKTKSGS